MHDSAPLDARPWIAVGAALLLALTVAAPAVARLRGVLGVTDQGVCGVWATGQPPDWGHLCAR